MKDKRNYYENGEIEIVDINGDVLCSKNVMMNMMSLYYELDYTKQTDRNIGDIINSAIVIMLQYQQLVKELYKEDNCKIVDTKLPLSENITTDCQRPHDIKYYLDQFFTTEKDLGYVIIDEFIYFYRTNQVDHYVPGNRVVLINEVSDKDVVHGKLFEKAPSSYIIISVHLDGSLNAIKEDNSNRTRGRRYTLCGSDCRLVVYSCSTQTSWIECASSLMRVAWMYK